MPRQAEEERLWTTSCRGSAVRDRVAPLADGLLLVDGGRARVPDGLATAVLTALLSREQMRLTLSDG